MKKKIIITIYVILLLITLKLLYNSTINNILIKKYNNGEYATNEAKALTFINFPESYIANYNYGNVLYQTGEYEKAIEQNKQSLKGAVPKERECKIRINYALAICKTVQLDEKDQKSIQNAIEKYESAIEILTEKGCANKNDNNGHNKQAETLKEDIQKEIDRLKKLQNQNMSNNNDSNNTESQEQNEEEIEEKIQEIKENATQKQRSVENQYENYGNFDYNKKEKNW